MEEERVIILLKAHHLKCTPPRIAVLSILLSSPYPISAEALFGGLEDKSIHLSTVYRTLNTFVEVGLARKEINDDKENVYSLLSEDDNHVLVCIKCHKKTPLPGCPYHEANEAIEAKTGYVLLDHSTEIYGVCPECKGK